MSTAMKDFIPSVMAGVMFIIAIVVLFYDGTFTYRVKVIFTPIPISIR